MHALLDWSAVSTTQAASGIAACTMLGTAVLCARRARGAAVHAGRPWSLFAASASTYAVAAVAHAAGIHDSHLIVAGRLAGTALLIWGVISLQPTQTRRCATTRTLLDALVVGAAFALAAWMGVLDHLPRETTTVADRVFGLLRPGAYGALSAAAVFVVAKRRLTHQSVVMLAAGGCAVIAGAEAAWLLSTTGATVPNWMIPSALATGFLLIALSAKHPDRGFEVSLLTDVPETRIGAVLPPTVAIAAVAFAGTIAVTRGGVDPVVCLTGMTLVTLLHARQIFTSRDRASLETHLVYQALHDPLTRLGNRILFQDRLDHALSRRRRGSEGIAVVFLDIDDFKVINDALGHAAGDQILIAVADRLRGCVRAEDTIARFGGDEFAVLLEGMPAPDDAREVAGRILASLNEPFTLRGRTINARASIGIAVARHNQSRDSILRDADVAMYAAKRLGKGRFETYEPSSNADAAGQLDLLTDLHQSVASGLRDMALTYEPIVDMRTRAIVGVRPRLRWHHVRRGVLSGEDFLPLAEQGGLAEKLNVWILATAAADARIWRERAGDNSPAVWAATSMRHLLHAGLIDEISQALDAGPLLPADLVIEIRESDLARSSNASLSMLSEMHSRGIRVAIAEFGSGGASLQSLDNVPTDILRIDPSLVDRIDRGAEASALPRGIIKLATTLGAVVVADGVTREEQRHTLVALGCVLGQGRLFSSAMDAEAITAMIGGSIESNTAG